MNPVQEAFFVESSGLAKQPAGLSHRVTADFAVNLADGLLKGTRQYARWQSIRKNDPQRTERIAGLVLARHEYVSGRAPRTSEHRLRFDALTEKLAADGIYLFKSGQFKRPIFPDASATSAKETPPPAPAERAPREESASLGLNELRERFPQKDCYEFLTAALERSGITYYGKDGLQTSLIETARRRGKAVNAYLTGEGLTQALSSNPVRLRVNGRNPQSAEDVWEKLQEHLQEGAILSFSSTKFGHTGIAARMNGRWVYLNSSGKAGLRSTYRILAEDLRQEIAGWIRKAERQETYLDITVGAIETSRAAAFFKDHSKSYDNDRALFNPLV